ncbi:hypothetical protein I4U23_011770 [Adineta vaga]|nr:hypothetical protein I4U23_011770 [Adineta vaga]
MNDANPVVTVDSIYGDDTANIQMRVFEPFSNQALVNQTISVLPAYFPEIDYSSTEGAEWNATSITRMSSQGILKLYICREQELGMWIPCGDWFETTESFGDCASTVEPNFTLGTPEERCTSSLQKNTTDVAQENSSSESSCDSEQLSTTVEIEATIEIDNKSADY